MNNCTMTERGWNGYFIDVITFGGYTAHRVFVYTKCIQSKTKKYT